MRWLQKLQQFSIPFTVSPIFCVLVLSDRSNYERQKIHVNQHTEIDGRSTCVAWAVCSPLPPRGQYCKCKDNHLHLKPAVEGAFQSYGEGWGGSKLVTIAAEQVRPLCSWKSGLLKILWTLKILTLLLHRRFVDLVWNSKSQIFYSVIKYIYMWNICKKEESMLLNES